MYLSKEWQRLLLCVLGGVAVCQPPVYASPKEKERAPSAEVGAARRRKNLSARSKQSISLDRKETAKHSQAGKQWKGKLLPWLRAAAYWIGGILLVLAAVAAWKSYEAEAKGSALLPLESQSESGSESGSLPPGPQSSWIKEDYENLRTEEIQQETMLERAAEGQDKPICLLQYDDFCAWLSRRKAGASFAQRALQFYEIFFDLDYGYVLPSSLSMLYQTLHGWASRCSCEIVEIYPSIEVVLLKDEYSCGLYLLDLKKSILVNPYASTEDLSRNPVLTETYVRQMGADRRGQSFFINTQWPDMVTNFSLSRSAKGELIIKALYVTYVHPPLMLYGGSAELYAWRKKSRILSQREAYSPWIEEYALESMPKTHWTRQEDYFFCLQKDTTKLEAEALQLLNGADGKPAFLLTRERIRPQKFSTIFLYSLKEKGVFFRLKLGKPADLVKAIHEPHTSYLCLYLAEHEEKSAAVLQENIYKLNRDDRGKLSFQGMMQQTLFRGNKFTILEPGEELQLCGSYVPKDEEELKPFTIPMGIATPRCPSGIPGPVASELLPPQLVQKEYKGAAEAKEEEEEEEEKKEDA